MVNGADPRGGLGGGGLTCDITQKRTFWAPVTFTDVKPAIKNNEHSDVYLISPLN